MLVGSDVSFNQNDSVQWKTPSVSILFLIPAFPCALVQPTNRTAKLYKITRSPIGSDGYVFYPSPGQEGFHFAAIIECNLTNQLFARKQESRPPTCIPKTADPSGARPVPLPTGRATMYGNQYRPPIRINKQFRSIGYQNQHTIEAITHRPIFILLLAILGPGQRHGPRAPAVAKPAAPALPPRIVKTSLPQNAMRWHKND